MFKMKTDAEIRNVNIRREAHGDEFVRATDIRVMALDVPIADLSSAVHDIETFFDAADQPKLGEIYPLRVRHSVDNLEAKLGGKVTLKGCDARKIEITPRPGRVANVLFNIRSDSYTDKDIAALTKLYVDRECKIEILERQTHIEDMEQ